MPSGPSFEYPDKICFVTNRTIASRLWFVHCPELEEKILAHLAKYQEMYGVEIYGFVLMGNHYHLIAKFPRGNRYLFVGAFDSIIARLTKRYQKSFIDGVLWPRSPNIAVLPKPQDVLNKFLYTALNPISSGLVKNLGDFTGYRCVTDVINGQSKVFKLVNWQRYRNNKRHNPRLRPEEFEEEYQIRYSRLPDCEQLSQQEYKAHLSRELGSRREQIIERREKNGEGFAGPENLRRIEPGSVPRFTKTSERDTPRALVITSDPDAREEFLEEYFAKVEAYREASFKYRNGNLTAVFPPGSHRPRVFVSPAPPG